jgi:hypothetical protein
MHHVNGIKHQAHVEELVSWTGRERLRILWYRLRLTISEMNYATRRLTELQTRLPYQVEDLAQSAPGRSRHSSPETTRRLP